VSFFRNVGDFFKEVADLGKELGDISKQGTDELREISTDGFKEMVIKGNNNYKTSYEKMDEARSILHGAKADIEYELEQTKLKSDEVQKRFEENQLLKQKLIESCDNQLTVLVSDFSTLKKKFRMQLSQIHDTRAGFTSLQSQFTSQFVASLGLSFSFITMIEQRNRVEKANQTLADAKSLAVKAEAEVERLKTYQLKFKSILDYLNNENRVLKSLNRSLKQKMEQLRLLLSEGVTDVETARKSEKMFQIINALAEMIRNTGLLDEQLEIKQENKALLNKLNSHIKSWKEGK
jgi:hypothetical protein